MVSMKLQSKKIRKMIVLKTFADILEKFYINENKVHIIA